VIEVDALVAMGLVAMGLVTAICCGLIVYELIRHARRASGCGRWRASRC